MQVVRHEDHRVQSDRGEVLWKLVPTRLNDAPHLAQKNFAIVDLAEQALAIY